MNNQTAGTRSTQRRTRRRKGETLEDDEEAERWAAECQKVPFYLFIKSEK